LKARLNLMPNRLQDEMSPYLLQHARNPVQWFPWGEEAFGKARTESKPIFLSIGYATCHWCHVMERESFENDATAALLNAFFVSIKVDREERPDVDRIYMTALQAMGQNGGWPMSMFLTADLRPFYGGTYYPPESRYGRAGFPEVLQRIHEIWVNERPKVEEAAEGILGFLNDVERSGSTAEHPDENIDVLCYQQLSSSYDEVNGGFGGGPKFPRPVVLGFLLGYHHRTGDPRALEMVAHTLRTMASGGMYDQIGGGFHRYSVDAGWRVPHFEKMLYDQAQLVVAYLHAYNVGRDPLYSGVARETLDYVLREMTDAEGGFHSAEDADSEKPDTNGEMGEGAFFVWSARELRALLGTDGTLFGLTYGVEEDGNVPDDPHHEFTGLNILYVAQPLETVAGRLGIPLSAAKEKIGEAKQALFDARSKRHRPFKDDKVLTAWNGLMIGALARGWRVLGDSRYGDAARRCAHFLTDRLYDRESGRLLRRFRLGEAGVDAQLSDYAFLVSGLLDLYEASGEDEWLGLGIRLTEAQILRFHDGVHGGFFDTPEGDSSLLIRMKEMHDGAEPAANSVAAVNLLRLSWMTGREDWRTLAEEIVTRGMPLLRKQPVALPMMASCAWSLRGGARQIVIAGEPGDPIREEMIDLAFRSYHPSTVIIHRPAIPSGDTHTLVNPLVSAYHALHGKSTAYLCRDFRCELPVTDVVEFARLLGRQGDRPAAESAGEE
jgi:uncharacterized protein YyaL (SSP411 family)